MYFLFLLFAIGAAHTREYEHTCLLSIDPYSSSTTTEYMIFAAGTCLARAYIAFPSVFEETLTQKLTQCITAIKQTDRSRPEYISLEKTISSITSNLGSTIVEAQHTLENMVYCTEPLKAITNVEIYEESRFDTVAQHFIQQMQKSHHCINHGIHNVELVTHSVATQITNFETQYEQWKNITLIRQADAELCRKDIKQILEDVTIHILRELQQ